MDALRLTLLISASLIIAACGGGGGGSGGGSPPAPPPPPPSTTTLNGVVQKGPMVAGSSVTVSSIDSNGNVTAQLANLTTSDNLGAFSTAVNQNQVVKMDD